MLALISKRFLQTLVVCALAFSSVAYASSGKSEGGGDSNARLEPFIVNLSTSDQFLQLSVTLKVDTAEFAQKVKLFMPVVRHQMILLLSSKEPNVLQSAKGKLELIEEIKGSVNKALEAKEHSGVVDIFFENFVIQ
jgi:flagellar protein FliL